MRRFSQVLLVWMAGCSGNPVGTAPGVAANGWGLSLDPPSALQEAQPVVAFILTAPPGEDAPLDPILVEGEVSKTSIAKYMAGETTEALAERIVPTQVEFSSVRLVMRPNHVLAIGQKYELLSRAGSHGSVSVKPNPELTYLNRLWPPRDCNESSLQTIYCGSNAPTTSFNIELFPSNQTALLVPGLDDEMLAVGNCVRIVPDVVHGQLVQPPPAFDGRAFEPTPWVVGDSLPAVVPLACSPSESELGPGCLGFDRGQAIIRTPSASTFWVLSSALGWHLQASEGGGRFNLPEIAELSDGRLDALTFDLAGRSFAASVRVIAPPPSARVVVNEVMANPLGPEPAEEWIELTNGGLVAAEMTGWKLRDEAGEVEIPPLRLEPGAFVLLVRRDFVGGQAGDVPPANDSTLVRLPSLGKNGLSNSGETVTIVDDQGLIVSRFPGRASDVPGTSVARRDPAELDDAPNGFGPHATPGASPGTNNVVQ